MSDPLPPHERLSRQISGFLGSLREYLGLGGSKRKEAVQDPASLRRFLETRASFVAQTSLYGYLRTRAGVRFPELFDDDDFVVSINIAKWHIWLDCLADISIYAGALLMERSERERAEIASFMEGLVEAILKDAGWPHEAGPAFPDHVEEVLTRLRNCRWTAITDDDAAFSASPASLVAWAPIVDELKQLDETIVKNSVRFRWKEIRHDLRVNLDAERLADTL